MRRVIAQVKAEARQFVANTWQVSEADFTGEARIGLFEALDAGDVFGGRMIEHVIEEHILRRLLRFLASRQQHSSSGLRGWSSSLYQNISAFERVPPAHIGGRPIVAYATAVDGTHCHIDVGAPLGWIERPLALGRERAIYAIRAHIKLGSRFHKRDELMLLDAGSRKAERLIGLEALLTWETNRNSVESACANLVSMDKEERLTAKFAGDTRTFAPGKVAVHRILRVEDLVIA
jgi:hypothetical protein